MENAHAGRCRFPVSAAALFAIAIAEGLRKA